MNKKGSSRAAGDNAAYYWSSVVYIICTVLFSHTKLLLLSDQAVVVFSLLHYFHCSLCGVSTFKILDSSASVFVFVIFLYLK